MNFKANIAFGGERSEDIVILKNTIHSSRSEGIFILEAGYAWIYNNEVHDNHDGVILYDSNCHLNGNVFRDNLR